MRKLTCIFASIIFSLQLFGECVPNIEAHIQSPRRFFHKLFNIAQSVYPDPKMQMQISFALIPFGFPSFNGISQTENALICVYDIEESPTITVALKTEGNKQPLVEQALQGICTFHNQDGYLIIAYSPQEDTTEYIQSTKKYISDKKISNFAKIKFDKVATKFLFKNNQSKFLDDIESSILKIDNDLTRIKLSLDFHFKKNSQTEKLVNAVKRDNYAEESAFIPQDCEISAISKIILPSNFPDLRKNVIEGIFAQDNAEKIKNMYLKNKGTFAMGINLGKNLQITSVGETAMTQQEFIELAKNNSQINYGANNSLAIINNIKNIENKSCVESYISTLPSQKTYSSIERQYAVSSTNIRDWKESIKKINARDNKKEFTLQKYAFDDSDFILVLNNKSTLKRLLAELGVKIKEDIKIDDTVVSADIGLSKIKLYTSIDLQILKYYCDIYGKTK